MQAQRGRCLGRTSEGALVLVEGRADRGARPECLSPTALVRSGRGPWEPFFVAPADSSGMIAVSRQGPDVDPAMPPELPSPPEVDERLETAQAFRRFAERVTLRAGRWLARLGVPEADRDDVLQEALLQLYKRRESYDPEKGGWKAWAFAFVCRVVLNYRRTRGTRVKRVDVEREALRDMATDAPSPEEATEAVMMQALLEKCLANIDDDSRAILHASTDGI
jgi:RNA polymerase sigma-70 factor, ECF subfamily